MNVSLLNYANHFSKVLLSQAQKVNIRDFDEPTTKHFVAYADDKSVSYDVSISLDAKKNIIESTCDCDQGGGWCVHKIAFTVYLYELKFKKPIRKARAKKVDPTEALLNQIESEELKSWLLSILKKNSELAFLFENEFNPTQKIFVAEDINLIIENSIKSVIGKRKSIQTNELKKLVDILDVSLQPVVDFMLDNTQKPDKMLLLFKINNILLAFNDNMYVTSVKIIRYIEKINHTYFSTINNIQDFNAWKIQFEYFFNNTCLDNKLASETMLKILKNTYDYCENIPLKKDFVIQKLILLGTKSSTNHLKYFSNFHLFVLDIYINHDLLKSYPKQFTARVFENEYNHKLIKALLAIKDYENAAEICKKCINDNVNELYDVPYIDFLRNIYTTTNQVNSLVLLVKKSILNNFSVEDYQLLQEHLDEGELKRIRSSIIASLKAKSYSDESYIKNYFEILALDSDYNKMISAISYGVSYEVVYPYREELYKANKVFFWNKLIILDAHTYYLSAEKKELITMFAKWALERYDPVFLFKQSTVNRFLDKSFFLKEVFKK
jgi:hypothetical protein